MDYYPAGALCADSFAKTKMSEMYTPIMKSGCSGKDIKGINIYADVERSNLIQVSNIGITSFVPTLALSAYVNRKAMR